MLYLERHNFEIAATNNLDGGVSIEIVQASVAARTPGKSAVSPSIPGSPVFRITTVAKHKELILCPCIC